MLAMAHGSNEINVSAPLAAQLYMLNPQTITVYGKEEIVAICVGLVSVLLGIVTIGVRYLDKHREKFMKVSLLNGFIANTVASCCLFFSSYLGFTVSCTYILVPALTLLAKKDTGKTLDKFKSAKAILFAIGVTIFSAFFSVITAYCLLWLDYNGPYSNSNNVWCQLANSNSWYVK